MTCFSASKNKKKIILDIDNDVEVFEPTKTKSGYSESETFVVLMTVLEHYPDLFQFELLDYNTTKGIDFVVDYMGPKYIELKGTLTKKINHPFQLIYKFICYDLDVENNEIIEDIESLKTLIRGISFCQGMRSIMVKLIQVIVCIRKELLQYKAWK